MFRRVTTSKVLAVVSLCLHGISVQMTSIRTRLELPAIVVLVVSYSMALGCYFMVLACYYAQYRDILVLYGHINTMQVGLSHKDAYVQTLMNSRSVQCTASFLILLFHALCSSKFQKKLYDQFCGLITPTEGPLHIHEANYTLGTTYKSFLSHRSQYHLIFMIVFVFYGHLPVVLVCFHTHSGGDYAIYKLSFKREQLTRSEQSFGTTLMLGRFGLLQFCGIDVWNSF